ncbi:MAG: single-stranded DNA-binding protein [Bacteroidales bacterium]|nr:single-stranded DNA-binding protein [Bacteroidales bacterium]MBR6160501.1 single-stranded DNA-binding protein [Bacteroidales bacterium]
MSGVNKVILIGRLGKDPDMRTFETGSKRASFTMATSEIYKDKNGNRIENTEWHNIVCWRNLAEKAEQYLTKGKLIYLEGKLRTRSWDENGSKRYITEIEASTFTMLGSKNEGESTPVVTQVQNAQSTAPQPPAPEPTYEPLPQDTDDLPF